MQTNQSWQEQKTIREKIGHILPTLRWAIGYAWSIAPFLVAAQAILTLLLGILPAGQALIARNLVNSIASSLTTGAVFKETVLPWLAVSFGLILLQIVLEFLKEYWTELLKNKTSLVVITHLLTHAASLDLADFDNPEHYDKRDRAKRQSEERFFILIQKSAEWLTNLVQLISIIGVLISIAPLATLILLPVAIPYFLYMWRQSQDKYSVRHKNTTKRRWRIYYTDLLLSSRSQPEIRLFGLAPFLIERFRTLMREMIDDLQAIQFRIVGAGRIFTAVYSTIFYGLYGWIAWRIFQGLLTLGDFVVYGQAAIQMQNSVRRLSDLLSLMLEETLYVSDLRDFLNLKTQQKDQEPAKELPFLVKGQIDFEDVHFRYPHTEAVILRGVSFSISPGEIVALVGHNGAGKSTIVKLLSGFYRPGQGAIKLDGLNIHEYKIEDIHKQITTVMQNFNQYEATVAENIAYGNWQRLLEDPEQIKLIAERSGISEMIEALPHQYDTHLGRLFGEIELSGGEWQKIALTRAFGRNSPIIILDEPTAHLDVEAEFNLFSKMRELARGRTAILISHRFSTVQLADRILVLDDGRIVEEGTHVQLMALDGKYAYLYKLHKTQYGQE